MRHTRALIAEDEPVLREELKQSLAALWPELVVCAEAADGVEAVRALEAYAPDILFLDIEMPGMSGLEVARLANGRCHVVFVTAYDKYAVAAFDQHAADYILKPHTMARLADCVARLKERIDERPAKIDTILSSLGETNRPQYLQWITALHGNKVRLVTVEGVCYFQADNKYTRVVTADGELLIRRSIKDLAQELDPGKFWQVHRSTVVNVGEIAEVTRDLHGHLKIRLRNRPESLAVAEAYNHLFKHM
jgi:DNA-binding LytR/AlgR family response regulator